MAQSLARVLVHTVFSTKERRPFLRDRALRLEMHRYLGGVTLDDENLNSVVARGSLIMVGADSGPTSGLFRSVNTGSTFTLISGASGTGLPAGAISHLVADPAHTNDYYVHVVGNGGYPHRGLGGSQDQVGGSGGFGGGGGGGGGAGAARYGGSGGNGGPGGQYGGAGGTSCCSFAGGGGGGAGLGGALFVSTGMVTIVNCSFTGNVATNGVGGYGSFGNGTAADGEGVGGAIFNFDAVVTAQNVTFNNNSASTSDNDVSITTLVTSLADAGLGSLRQAIANAAVRPGADTITFATYLSGGVIDLTSSELDITDSSGPLTITASNLAGGIAINGQGARRGFNIAASSLVTLDSLTVSNCLADSGGGVRGASTGTLTDNIIAANVSSNQPDLNVPSALASHNLVRDGTDSGLTNGVDGNLVGTAATFGRLQSAPSLNGPWTDVIGALSGQLLPVTSEAQYFRIGE